MESGGGFRSGPGGADDGDDSDGIPESLRCRASHDPAVVIATHGEEGKGRRSDIHATVAGRGHIIHADLTLRLNQTEMGYGPPRFVPLWDEFVARFAEKYRRKWGG